MNKFFIFIFTFILVFSCVKKQKVVEKETIATSINDTIEIENKGINKEIIETKKAIAKDKENARLHLKLAKENLQKHNTFSALKAAENAVKYKPNSAEAYKIIGDTYFNSENYKEAKANYIKALSINENYAEAHYGLGNCLLVEKEYKGAIEEYNLALKSNPNYELAYLNRGVAFSKIKEYQQALNDFLKLISLNKNSPRAYINAGIMFEKIKNYQKAIEYYQEYLKYDPANMTVKKWILNLKNKGE